MEARQGMVNLRRALLNVVIPAVVGAVAMHELRAHWKQTTQAPAEPAATWVPASTAQSSDCGPMFLVDFCTSLRRHRRASRQDCPFGPTPVVELDWAQGPAELRGHLVDKWGNSLVLSCEHRRGRWELMARSLGPDGVLDSQDDIEMPCISEDF